MKYYIITILTLFILTSCNEKIDLEVPGADPVLVVEGEITTETDSSFIKLTLSSNYFGPTKYQVVDNATVKVNGISFDFNAAKGVYKPSAGYVAKSDSTYNLEINYNGKTYTSASRLEPMFIIVGDTLFQTFRPKEGFLDAGYSINYRGLDNRPRVKYTYFQLGYFDTIVKRDSFSNAKVLFDNITVPIGVPYDFELPFTRFQSGEEFFCIFRSIDKNMYDFIRAYNQQSTGAPGPFQVPAANLPTNISAPKGTTVVGYFAAYDVRRYRYLVK